MEIISVNIDPAEFNRTSAIWSLFTELRPATAYKPEAFELELGFQRVFVTRPAIEWHERFR